MKKIYSLLAIILVLISCKKREISVENLAKTGMLKELLAKKKEITIRLEVLKEDLEIINSAITKKDTVKKFPLITTITIKKEVFKHYLEVQGNVKTNQNILVYPEIPGTLKKVLVEEGDRVFEGQLLAIIDDGGLSSQVAQIETTTQLAKTTYERQKSLWEKKIGSEIQYLQAKTNYESQKHTLNQIKSQQAKAFIKAPFTGVIDEIIKEQGTVIAPGPGSEVFRIVNLNNMYIEADVSERYITQIKKNKEVKIQLPILGETIKSKIRQVGSFINPNNRTFKIEVPVDNKSGNIKPNLTAKLHINDYTNDKAVLIPQSIISENSRGNEYVYVITNKKRNNEATTKKLIIKTGRSQKGYTEVLSKIAVGTEIINEGARSVNEGQPVKIIN